MKAAVPGALLFAALLFCGSGKEARDVTPQQSARPGEAFAAIETARKNKPLDFSVMDTLYRSSLASRTARIDSSIHQRIVQALDAGARGEMPHVQSQRVSKLLQKAFFLESARIIEELGDDAGGKDTAAIQQLRQAYEVLHHTVLRRSEWLGKGREMDELARGALRQIEEASNQAETDNASDALQEQLVKTYVYSVYYEFDGIEQNRGGNATKCEEKMEEARIFFEIVSPYAVNSTAAEKLHSALADDYSRWDIETMRDMMNTAFSIENPQRM